MRERPIGMFDSGFGGVGVLAEAVRALPEEDFIFVGDNARAPYGARAPEEVLRFTHEAVDKLIQMGCKAIVIACNTATSAAAAPLRQELTLPIIGMEPALKPASLMPGEGKILVLATAVTLHLEKFQRLMALYGKDAVPVPCPVLVEHVERGEVEGPLVEASLRGLLAPFMDQPIKADVLGCTHYVFLRRTLAAVLPGVPLVDGNAGTIRQLRRRLQEENLLRRQPDHKGSATLLSSSEEAQSRMEAMLRYALALPR